MSEKTTRKPIKKMPPSVANFPRKSGVKLSETSAPGSKVGLKTDSAVATSGSVEEKKLVADGESASNSVEGKVDSKESSGSTNSVNDNSVNDNSVNDNSVTSNQKEEGTKKMAQTLDTKARKGNKVAYTIDGVPARFKVLYPKGVFAGEPPATITADTVFNVAKAASSMTKEERKAARDAETPAQRAEKLRKQIERQNARLAKLEASAAAPATV